MAQVERKDVIREVDGGHEIFTKDIKGYADLTLGEIAGGNAARAAALMQANGENAITAENIVDTELMDSTLSELKAFEGKNAILFPNNEITLATYETAAGTKTAKAAAFGDITLDALTEKLMVQIHGQQRGHVHLWDEKAQPVIAANPERFAHLIDAPSNTSIASTAENIEDLKGQMAELNEKLAELQTSREANVSATDQVNSDISTLSVDAFKTELEAAQENGNHDAMVKGLQLAILRFEPNDLHAIIDSQSTDGDLNPDVSKALNTAYNKLAAERPHELINMGEGRYIVLQNILEGDGVDIPDYANLKEPGPNKSQEFKDYAANQSQLYGGSVQHALLSDIDISRQENAEQAVGATEGATASEDGTKAAEAEPENAPAQTSFKVGNYNNPTITVDGDPIHVMDVQRKLEAAGFEIGGVDGHYGPKTEAAVKKVQEMLGLEADGKYGPETHRAFSIEKVIELRTAKNAEIESIREMATSQSVTPETFQSASLDGDGITGDKLTQVLNDIEDQAAKIYAKTPSKSDVSVTEFLANVTGGPQATRDFVNSIADNGVAMVKTQDGKTVEINLHAEGDALKQEIAQAAEVIGNINIADVASPGEEAAYQKDFIKQGKDLAELKTQLIRTSDVSGAREANLRAVEDAGAPNAPTSTSTARGQEANR